MNILGEYAHLLCIHDKIPVLSNHPRMKTMGWGKRVRTSAWSSRLWKLIAWMLYAANKAEALSNSTEMPAFPDTYFCNTQLSWGWFNGRSTQWRTEALSFPTCSEKTEQEAAASDTLLPTAKQLLPGQGVEACCRKLWDFGVLGIFGRYPFLSNTSFKLLHVAQARSFNSSWAFPVLSLSLYSTYYTHSIAA